jgi:penicillin-binding protein 1A
VTRSLALGVAEVSVIDMASAYSVFASGGYKTPAYGITRINTLNGEPVYEAQPDAPRERILSQQTVEYMDELFRAVVTGGTGTRARVEGVPAVGKTGTTSDYRDAWFCGFTGNYVATVWYGNDDYHQTRRLTGGMLPAMTWQKFMTYAHTNIEIKPVLGIDFKPAPFVIAKAEPDAAGGQQVERPPSLQPEAARKLIEIAGMLQAVRAAGSGTGSSDQASLTAAPPAAARESL